MKILTFGEIIWDVYPDKAYIGGAPFNFAAHSARLGAKAYMLSSVGKDDLGDRAIKEAERFGISCEYITVSDKKTGRCMVTLDSSGVPSYNILEDTAYDSLTVSDEIKKDSFDAICFGTLALRAENNKGAIKELLSLGITCEIFADVNIRAPFYSKESIDICLENASILKISDEELSCVTSLAFGKGDLTPAESADTLLKSYKNIKIVIITLGAKGALAYCREDGKEYRIPAHKAKVVSTVGAGDSFGAAFLVSYLSGKSIEECLEKAAEVSAYVVSHADAIPE